MALSANGTVPPPGLTFCLLAIKMVVRAPTRCRMAVLFGALMMHVRKVNSLYVYEKAVCATHLPGPRPLV